MNVGSRNSYTAPPFAELDSLARLAAREHNVFVDLTPQSEASVGDSDRRTSYEISASTSENAGGHSPSPAGSCCNVATLI